jgi:hypothetical protein
LNGQKRFFLKAIILGNFTVLSLIQNYKLKHFYQVSFFVRETLLKIKNGRVPNDFCSALAL